MPRFLALSSLALYAAGTKSRSLQGLEATRTNVEDAFRRLQECQDLPSTGIWVSSTGATCQQYETFEGGLCTPSGDYGPAWNGAWGTFEDWGVDGVDATDACCACGGGEASPTDSPTEAPTDAPGSPTDSPTTDSPTDAPTDSLPCEDLPSSTGIWVSSTGATCQQYETFEGGLCTPSGDYGPAWNGAWGTFEDWGVDGVDATDACCACGGGVATAAPTEYTTDEPTVFETTDEPTVLEVTDAPTDSLPCVDLPSSTGIWVSSTGATCQQYETFEGGLCTPSGDYGPAWNGAWGTFEDWGVDGVDATDACCACGGGVRTAEPTAAPMTLAPTSDDDTTRKLAEEEGLKALFFIDYGAPGTGTAPTHGRRLSATAVGCQAVAWAPGECGMLLSDMPHLCGSMPACAGAICGGKGFVIDGKAACIARGEMDFGAAPRADVYALSKEEAPVLQ